jgi:hypothetical protein
MNSTKISLENLQETITVSEEALPYFKKGGDEIGRFSFCAIEKISKTAQGIKRLYTALDGNDDLEFPLGILLRSLMMDNLMVQNIKYKIFSAKDDNPQIENAAIKEIVKEICYKFLADGTDNFIKDLKLSDNFSPAEQEAAAMRFASMFSKAYDLSSGKPVLKKGFKYQLKELYNNSKHESLVSLESTYNLYTFWSKYDHLSHWTSMAKGIPFERRKGKIDLAIVIVLMELRDVLVLAYDFDPNYSVFEPLFNQIQQHLEKEYDPELAKAASTSD